MDATRTVNEPLGIAVPESAEVATLALRQLQTAVADISRVLTQSLRDERDHVVNHLRRAENLLKARIALAATPGGGNRPRLAAWQVKRVQEYIETKLETAIRNKDLADLLERSEFHFCAAFRNSVGDSPHEYIIRRRIERAQKLMTTTQMPLCEVAFACGLADQAHLSRLFRRIVGHTPAMWRRARSMEAAGMA